jgi:hypothetical protein
MPLPAAVLPALETTIDIGVAPPDVRIEENNTSAGFAIPRFAIALVLGVYKLDADAIDGAVVTKVLS